MSTSLKEKFDACGGEFLEFESIAAPRCVRPDLHAFLLLHELLPGRNDMISAAAHDEIWLNVDCDALAAVVTQEQVIELVRCGVRFDASNDVLEMFV